MRVKERRCVSVRIGELRRQTGVGLHLLRYYEDRGLLHPVRTASGYRVYRPDDVERVRQIRLLLAAGLSTAVIGEVLPCLDDTDGQLIVLCEQTRGTILDEYLRLEDAAARLADSRHLLGQILQHSEVTPLTH